MDQQPNNQPTPTPVTPAAPPLIQPVSSQVLFTPTPASLPQAQVSGPQQFAPPTTVPAVVSAVPTALVPTVEAKVNADKKGANSTQNALQIAEIRDGIVIMNDGSYRSVIMAKSINFDLMSAEEREAVEFAYQGFLNSLYFPIQIFIRSSRIDIRPYIEKLDKLRQEQDNMLLAMMMEDYIAFVANLSQETNIMDKRFYVVIPYYSEVTTQAAIKSGKKLFGNLFSAFNQNKAHPIITVDEATIEKAKIELRNRVQAVTSALAQVSVQTVALDTEELIELYYDAYNPDTATRQQLRNFPDMTAEVVTKGQGQASNPSLGGDEV